MSDKENKRKLTSITRDIFEDQLAVMVNIHQQTGENVASQIRKALDKELKLGAYNDK